MKYSYFSTSLKSNCLRLRCVATSLLPIVVFIRCIVIIILLLTLIVGCKPTIKGETNKFHQNQHKIVTLKSEFPRFKKYLDELSQKARDIFNESDSIALEEQKVEKMIEANRTFYKDRLFDELNNYNRLLGIVDNKRQDLLLIRDIEYKIIIQTVVDNIDYQVKEAVNLLRYSNAQSYNDALADIDKANTILTQAEGILKETITAINKDKKKSKSDGDAPVADEQEDLGGRESSGSGSDDGSRGGTTSEEEGPGGRD